jgi:hypothetical protein
VYWIELTQVLLIFCFMLSVAMISDLYFMFVTFLIGSEHVAKIMLSCHESVCHVFFFAAVDFNPLPALTLRSARDLNVPCSQKRSQALLLTKKKNRIFFKKEDIFTFRTKTQPFAGPIKSPTACADGLCFSVAFADYTRNRSPREKNHNN